MCDCHDCIRYTPRVAQRLAAKRGARAQARYERARARLTRTPQGRAFLQEMDAIVDRVLGGV